MDLELTLSRPDTQQTQVAVTCNDQPSHTFDLHSLIPTKANGVPHPIEEIIAYGTKHNAALSQSSMKEKIEKLVIAYGTALYVALFPPGSPAQQALDRRPERVLLVAADPDLDAIPWEYVYGPDGFLVCDYPFVRGLPPKQRIPAPEQLGSLHIVAVPSNPLHPRLAPLNIEGEWIRLVDGVRRLTSAVTLERVWPPTIERLRALVANQPQRVVHFPTRCATSGIASLRQRDGPEDLSKIGEVFAACACYADPAAKNGGGSSVPHD